MNDPNKHNDDPNANGQQPEEKAVKLPDFSPLTNPDTAILSSETLKHLRRQGAAKISSFTDSLNEKREIILVIRGIVERVVLDEHSTLVLGRLDARARNRIDIDLTQYGAVDRGVSREHCRLDMRDGDLFVTDLDSTNGTFLAGKRLQPNLSTQLKKGDELILGRLTVQVLFR